MVFEKVKKIIIDNLGVDEEDVTMESDIEDLGADSLDCIEIVMSIEEEFEIEIPDSEAEKLRTVGDIVEYITENT